MYPIPNPTPNTISLKGDASQESDNPFKLMYTKGVHWLAFGQPKTILKFINFSIEIFTFMNHRRKYEPVNATNYLDHH